MCFVEAFFLEWIEYPGRKKIYPDMSLVTSLQKENYSLTLIYIWFWKVDKKDLDFPIIVNNKVYLVGFHLSKV
jgi:hypothetical protein